MSVNAKIRKAQLPAAVIRAEFAPSTFDKEKRTIQVIWSVGKKGLRSAWGESYFEQLSMDPAHCKMDRLASGNSPFVDAHEHRWVGNRAVLGVVESAKIENGVGTAIVRLVDPETLRNPDAADTIRKIEGGFLKNISVGYNVYHYDRQPAVEGEDIPTYLAVDWEPTEISTVPVGFDEHAVVRGKDDSGAPCVFEDKNVPNARNEEASKMTEQEKIEHERKLAAEKAAAEKAAAEKARDEEKARQAEIRAIVSKHGLPAELAERAVGEDRSIAEVKDMVLAELAKKSEQAETRNAQATATGGKPNQIAERKLGLENALMHRANPGVIALTEAGRHFRGMSLIEMARDMLEAGGASCRGLSKMDLATRAFHSTSDFPEVLANVAGKSLRKGYDEAPRTFTGWAKQASLPDFKQVSRTQLGEAPMLEKVGENGEITRSTIGEGAEKYQLATYAKIVAITRQVLINDDLNAFANIPQKFGFSAAALESDVVYAILTANAALADGVALFHGTHKNLGTAGAPSVTTLAELRKLMRLQVGVDKKRILNIMAKYMIVPAALELVAEQLLSQLIVATQTSNANPFINKLVPVVEPRLDAASATAWYVAADPNQVDTVEYGYLEGQQGVYSESRMGFDVDGLEVKARLDFAAKAIDFRGLAKNAG